MKIRGERPKEQNSMTPSTQFWKATPRTHAMISSGINAYIWDHEKPGCSILGGRIADS